MRVIQEPATLSVQAWHGEALWHPCPTREGVCVRDSQNPKSHDHAGRAEAAAGGGGGDDMAWEEPLYPAEELRGACQPDTKAPALPRDPKHRIALSGAQSEELL